MADLIIPANTTQTIDVPLPPNLIYDNFTMGDHSKIITKVSLSIQALSATFGQGCIIDGSGTDGGDGKPQTYVPAQVGNCNRGDDGHPGNPGESGTNGRDIHLQIGIKAIGSLLLIAKGGNGGSGSRGGIGGHGGAAQCVLCKGGDGGRGGPGGAAGAGGDSGQITVVWSPLSSFLANRGLTEKHLKEIENELRQKGYAVAAPGNEELFLVPPTGVDHEPYGGWAGEPGGRGPGGHGGDGAPCPLYGMAGGGAGGWGPPGAPARWGLSKEPIYVMQRKRP